MLWSFWSKMSKTHLIIFYGGFLLLTDSAFASSSPGPIVTAVPSDKLGVCFISCVQKSVNTKSYITVKGSETCLPDLTSSHCLRLEKDEPEHFCDLKRRQKIVVKFVTDGICN